MKKQSVKLTMQLDKIVRIDGNRKVTIYMDKLYMWIPKQRLMQIISPSMMVDVTFSPVRGPTFDTGNVYVTILGPTVITTQYRTTEFGEGRIETTYNYRINSGIFPMEGVISSEEELPFLDSQYYLVLVTKHEDKENDDL